MENIEIFFEDDNLLVLDKPAGILVHPTQAKETDTLADWLIQKYPETKNLDWPDKTRPGIVHRLDKDTSGLIIIAKNPEILEKMQSQFKTHDIKKTYQALVWGKVVPPEGKIEAAIVRDKTNDRMKTQEMTFTFTRGTVRPSVTFYKTIGLYTYKTTPLSLVEVYPQTGRMHQIRVHFKHLGYPLIGDQIYFNKPSKRISKELNFTRQFLHAVKLHFTHPITGKEMAFESKLAEELKQILARLKPIVD
jgi:23S rRNA pseudouridine1911/1915/1917 synthase